MAAVLRVKSGDGNVCCLLMNANRSTTSQMSSVPVTTASAIVRSLASANPVSWM